MRAEISRDLKLIVLGAGMLGVGVLLGTTFFGSSPAEAQRGPYRECVIGHQETHDIRGNGTWERQEREFQGDRRIQIPRGWEVVSGGGVGAQNYRFGTILICRR